MQKVFAVFILAILLTSCSKSNLIEKDDHKEVYKENLLYRVPGDFDGDEKNENFYVFYDKTGIPMLKVIDDDSKNYVIKLNKRFNNCTTYAVDIDMDNREEILLYTIDDCIKKVYAFSFNDGFLYELLSPEIFSEAVEFKQTKRGYVIECGNLRKEIETSDKLYLNFYSTDFDYSGSNIYFISEGSITSSENCTLFILTIIYKIDSSGKIDFMDIKISSLDTNP
ncbi:hypothetical protein [Fonticella tunisiensis]|uniref:Uncharacterized protein n=1 Tax=Fonticella tunisiensis TaxID=1096341 RepID=A0A4R7KR35_9CLOT|nr:hypothetical protein [Fonticella tunisiensis]TDT61144.1 hypothetical protein EDD71_10841 [Fonticella tunisiensis]